MPTQHAAQPAGPHPLADALQRERAAAAPVRLFDLVGHALPPPQQRLDDLACLVLHQHAQALREKAVSAQGCLAAGKRSKS